MIRPCANADFHAIEALINEAAQAYRGAIPADCWHEPYMTDSALKAGIEAGVKFSGFDESSTLIGIMGPACSRRHSDPPRIRATGTSRPGNRWGAAHVLDGADDGPIAGLAHGPRVIGQSVLRATWFSARLAGREEPTSHYHTGASPHGRKKRQ
jgi:hypothetical protein